MIGENIRRLRTENNMTQKDLADKLFVSAQAVSRWEKEEVEPSITTISEIASLFKVSTDELLGVQAPQAQKEEPKVVYTAAEPVLALCEECNTPIYNKDDIHREEKTHYHGRSSTHETHIYCPDCHRKHAEEEERRARVKKQQDIADARRRRIWSVILGALTAGILFAAAFSLYQKDPSYLACVIAAPILGFTFVSCLLLKNNFIGEMTSTIFEWGFVKFPGLIFSWDLDGFLWVIGMKLLFFFLGIALACLTGILALLLGSSISFFVYPFALAKSIRNPEDYDD